MEVDFGEVLPPDVCLEAAELEFQLSRNLLGSGQKSEGLKKLNFLINEHKMVSFGRKCMKSVPNCGVTDANIAALAKECEGKLAELKAKLKDAEENLGDVEIIAINKEMLTMIHKMETKENALEQYKKVLALKGLSIGQKIDLNVDRCLLGFFHMDFAIIRESLAAADALLEEGGDWERRNRVRTYSGVFCLLQRKWKEGSELLLSVLATFNCTELMTYEKFVQYVVVSSLVSLDRVAFNDKVRKSSNVKAVAIEGTVLHELANSLHECSYGEFLLATLKTYDALNVDRFLYQHADWFVREVRVKAYTQFLQAYKSVTLEMMSYEFGISESLLDTELGRFISNGRISAKIDKKEGVLTKQEINNKNARYVDVIKQGDLLLNKVQTLSRLLGV